MANNAIVINMTVRKWQAQVLAEPGASGRVAEIERDMRLAAALTSLREQAGLSQRELAHKIGVSQPRVAAIERSRNVTLDVLVQYVAGLGGGLEVAMVRGGKRIPLLAPARTTDRKKAGGRGTKTR